MSKKLVTTRKFTIIDLVRYKPTTKLLTVDPTRIDITIDVTTKGLIKPDPAPSTAMDRLEKAARDALATYETTITEELKKFEVKLAKMAEDPDTTEKDLTDIATTVNHAVKNALLSAEGAANQAVAARLEKEKQGDKNLKEAKVLLGLKVTLGVVRITTNVLALVGSSGADVTAYRAILVTLKGFYDEITQAMKAEAALSEDFRTAIKEYMQYRESAITQAAARQMVDTSNLSVSKPLQSLREIVSRVKAAGKEILKDRDPADVLKEVASFVTKAIKKPADKVETARSAYRNDVVAYRQKIDKLSGANDKLMKLVKESKTLKEGVKLGAQAMVAKRNIGTMVKVLEDREKTLDEFNYMTKANGLEVDDSTIIDRLKKMDPKEIFTQGKALREAIGEIKDLVEAII